MALPQAIDIRISMLRLAPQCFAFTSRVERGNLGYGVIWEIYLQSAFYEE